MIHEAVHAVAGQCHGNRWLARMEKAAATVDAIGRHELATLLREQIAAYGDPTNRVTAAGVYQEIADVVRDNHKVTFRQAVDFVRRDFGLPREKFLRRFRRTRVVFEQAKQEAADHAKARAMDWPSSG